MAQPPGHTTQLQNWLELLRAGDPEARQRVIEHVCERLQLLTRKMLGRYEKVRRWEETDDVFIEALSKLHRSLESVRPESPRHFYNLAATQIRRVLVDFARRYYGPEGMGAHHDTGGFDQEGLLVPRHEQADCTGEPSNLMEWTEFHQQVEALPDDEREVFNLLWYQELTQDDAAEVLGISIRTVRRRWQSARLMVFDALKGQLPQ